MEGAGRCLRPVILSEQTLQIREFVEHLSADSGVGQEAAVTVILQRAATDEKSFRHLTTRQVDVTAEERAVRGGNLAHLLRDGREPVEERFHFRRFPPDDFFFCHCVLFGVVSDRSLLFPWPFDSINRLNLQQPFD